MILFTKCLYVGDGRKSPETKAKKIKPTKSKEKFRLIALPSPFYDMEANCFLVFENAENKHGLP